jgi:serine/threonine protein kinase
VLVRTLLEGLPFSCIPQSLIIQCTSVRPKPLIHGGAADIYEGALDGRMVAVKRYRVDVTSRQPGFLVCREALLWNQLRHSNVLPFLGVDSSQFGGDLCLVSPWAQHGNIMDYMRKPANLDAHIGRCVR